MNTGKTLFAQLMDFLPWTTFTRIVDRYGGDHRVRAFLRRAMHGLRPADLPARQRRSTHRNSITWASASRSGARRRCQRGATGVSMRRWPSGSSPRRGAVRRRRTGVGPDQYRLRPGLDDHRSVPVGLSVGGTTKAAVKMHTLLDLRGNIRVLSTSRMEAARRSSALAGSRSHLRRGSWVDFARCCTKPGPSSSCQANIDAHRVYSAPTDRRPASFAQTISLDATPVRITPNFCGASVKDPESGDAVFITNNFSLPAEALQKPLAGGTLLQVDQAASSDQAVLRHVGERVKTQIWIAVSVYVLVAIVKKRLDLDASPW